MNLTVQVFLEARASLELGPSVTQSVSHSLTHVLAVLHSRSIVILFNGLDRQDSYQEGPESNQDIQDSQKDDWDSH